MVVRGGLDGLEVCTFWVRWRNAAPPPISYSYIKIPSHTLLSVVRPHAYSFYSLSYWIDSPTSNTTWLQLLR